jgi:ribose transport system substrate-binding protein
MFLKSLPEGSAELQVMVCEGNDEKEISNIKSLVARGGKDTILFIDPNQAPNAAVVADICEEAGVYWTSCWSTAEGVYPGQYPHYAMFQSPDDSKSGYDIAIQLFNSFKTPGKGKILAIQGELANSAAINRFKGLQKALVENPGIELLDDQSGAWNPQKALTITESWLSKYKDIDGIWVANDGMALAVIQALKAKGLNGKVKVVGIDAIDDALTAIKDGDPVATVASNGWLQAGYGLAYAYAAYTGKIDPKTMGPEKNMIHTEGKLLTNANLADYENEFIKNKPVYDYNDLEGIILRPMNLPEDYKK